MKILFVTRPDALTRPGGDTIQLQKTQEALEALGVQVRLGQAAGEALAWADIVHVFNAQTPETSLPALRAARSAGKKAILSTIWWDLGHAQQASALSKFLGLGVPDLSWLLSLPFYRMADRAFRGSRYREVQDTLKSADLLLPNSPEELACLQRDFGVNLPPSRVVMNAVDTALFQPVPERQGRGIICCARVEPVKNQLALVHAVAGLPDVRLTLVGRGNYDERYNRQVRTAVKQYGFTWIEDHLAHPEMVRLMQDHAVHALPSFRESPGLSSLEALAAGLSVVVSARPFCPVDTYFRPWLDQQVFLCTPYRVASLRKAVQQALSHHAPVPGFPREFTWKDVGRQTLAAYHAL